MSKKQVWLMEHERDLVVTCIEYVMARLDAEVNHDRADPAHKACGKFARRRLLELKDKFMPEPTR